jgi:tetratricopeptide (TPR) repeat protein
LWGAGAGIAIPGIPKTTPQPQSTPSSATLPPGENALGIAATQHRDAISEAVSSKSFVPSAESANPAAGIGGFDMSGDEPAPRPNQQALATVMFERAAAAPAANPLGNMERAQPEPPAPAYEALNESSDRASGGASDEASDETYEETGPSRGTGSRATPTRSKYKSSKSSSKKGMKAKSVQRWSTAKDDDDSAGADLGRTSSSKAPIIIVAALGLIAIVAAAAYFLRGRTPPEPAPAAAESTPSAEPAAPAAKPVAKEEFVPPTPVAPVAKEKPARVEKAAHAEKPEKAAQPEKAEPLHSEVKPVTGKPTEEDFRRANDAYERGNTKLFQGNTAEAINDFNLALKLNPKDPVSHRGLGLAYAQSGKSSEALKHLKAYLKEAPKANDRAVIEKRIEQLKGQ